MKTDIRSLALIGARVRREELRAELAEVESTIKALQHPTAKKTAKVKPTKKRRVWTDKVRAEVLADASATSVAKAAKKYNVSPSLIYGWRKG